MMTRDEFIRAVAPEHAAELATLAAADAGRATAQLVIAAAREELTRRLPPKRRRRRTLAAANAEAMKAGLPVRAATLQPDGGVRLEFGKPDSEDVAERHEDVARLI
jgi:hypothetical protein